MTRGYPHPNAKRPGEHTARTSQSAISHPPITDPELALARWENEGGGPARAQFPSTRPGKVLSGDGRSGDPFPAALDTVANDWPTPRGTSEKDGLTARERVRVGRVYDERESHDHFRVLVDRLWPRGLSKARADIDEWCQGIAPSGALRTWYGHDPDRFVEFERRYRQELDDPDRHVALQHLRELARDRTVILLTATRHPEISEAAVLAHAVRIEEQTD